jgi:hypothetical protein
VIFWQINDSGAKMPDATVTRPGLLACIATQRRGTVMVEFAIVGPIFLILALMVFELAYDAFSQAVLDSAVQATARQIETGNAQNATTRSLLVSQVLCPNALGLLNCSGLYVRVESINQTTCPGITADLDDATDGNLPSSGGVVLLGLYGGIGTGGPTTCQNASSASGFCVAGTSQNGPELIVLSAVYLEPSFLGRLVQRTLTYQGSIVRGAFSSAAFITEGFYPTYTGTTC